MLDRLLMVYMALTYLENLRPCFKIKCCFRLVIWIKLGFWFFLLFFPALLNCHSTTETCGKSVSLYLIPTCRSWSESFDPSANLLPGWVQVMSWMKSILLGAVVLLIFSYCATDESIHAVFQFARPGQPRRLWITSGLTGALSGCKDQFWTHDHPQLGCRKGGEAVTVHGRPQSYSSGYGFPRHTGVSLLGASNVVCVV